MATIEIPKVRKESTVIMYVSLTDNGVTVDWTSLSEIKPFMYSDEQHCIAGKCTAEIATGAPETLIVRYPTTAPQFLGQNSLLIRCTYDGNEKSFDVPVLEFVDRSSEATGVTVIEDPELPVAIEVQDVDTSVLDDAIAAALDAAAKATAAAELVPLDILAQCQAAAEAAEAAAENCAPVIGDNGNWWIYDYDAGEYVDSGKPSRGIQGEQGIQGIQGIQGNTGSSVDYPYELVNNRTTDDATKGLSAAEGKRLGDDLSQLDQKLTDSREYGTITGKYISGNIWNSGQEAVSKYIKVIPGDEIHIVKNSAKNAYAAFISSVDTSVAPSFTNGTSSVQKTITDSTFQVITECYLWWLVDYDSSQHFEPSVLTLNGVDILTSTYAIDKLAEMEESLESFEEEVENIEDEQLSLQRDLSLLVGTYTPQGYIPADWGTPVEGKYWNLVDGSAGLVSENNYFARPTLYQANGGQRMFVTVKNSIINETGAAAYACYDNDGLPADGNAARRNWGTAETIVDNGDGTSTYTFVLPANTSQVGLFYKSEEVTYYFEQNESFNYSQTLDNHIQEVAGCGATTSGNSAKYYLKGASPKSFPNTKKIAILCAGQSNAEGRVPYADMPAGIKSAQPIANCHYVEDSESGAFASLNITGQWAFDLVTYYNLCVTANKEIYVMKWAEGGVSIDPLGDGADHWTADYEKLSSENNSLLRKFETEIRNHIASDGENFAIRAMLWHQGEGDRGSLGTGSDDRYYKNLRNMVSYIRGIVGDERLPFITGTISHNSAQYDAKIEAAQQRLASEDPYFCLIDMSGAPLLDSYHFDDDSSVYFGEMAYNALIDYGVLSATKLTPVRPW